MINKDTLWMFIFQILKIFNGLISILLVPIYLSSEEQGFWFLMLSFGSIILLFSASYNSVILIFGGHEFRQLNIKNSLMYGDIKHKRELYSFIKFSKSIFLNLLFILSIVVFIFYSLYIYDEELDNLILIFFIYVLGIIFFSINNSILTYLESFNKVKEAYIYKSFLMFFIVLLTIYFIINGYKLFSLAIPMFISMSIFTIYLIFKFKDIVNEILQNRLNFNKFKKKIFFNYFSKNSLSMISGFLLFQIYTPLVYYFYGSEVSGKVGLSISIFIALFTISTIFIHSKLPLVIKLISHKEYNSAYKIYFDASKKSIFYFCLFLFIGLFLLFNIDFFNLYREKVVATISFLILALSWFLQLIVYILVTYIRAFKRELFIIPTIVSVIYILIYSILILKLYLVEYIFLGLLSSYIIGLPWVYYIYKKFLNSKVENR